MSLFYFSAVHKKINAALKKMIGTIKKINGVLKRMIGKSNKILLQCGKM